MYIQASHTDKGGKPCGGVRYNALHNSSLGLHEIDMLGIIKKDFSQKGYNCNEAAETSRKSAGGKKCGGAFYALYHAPSHHPHGRHHKKHSHPGKKTIDTNFEHRNPAERQNAGHSEIQQAYRTSQDIFSIEEMLAYTSVLRERYVSRMYARGLENAYSRIEREAMGRVQNNDDIAYSLAEEVERKYGRAYSEGITRKYEGKSVKYQVLARPGKATLNDKKRKPAKDIEKALKNMERISKKERKSSKKAAKTKNETHRRALPSGLKTVRERPARSDRQGKKSRRNDCAKQSEPIKHSKKHRDTR